MYRRERCRGCGAGRRCKRNQRWDRREACQPLEDSRSFAKSGEWRGPHPYRLLRRKWQPSMESIWIPEPSIPNLVTTGGPHLWPHPTKTSSSLKTISSLTTPFDWCRGEKFDLIWFDLLVSGVFLFLQRFWVFHFRKCIVCYPPATWFSFFCWNQK